jgi:hypothetical protein
MRIKIDAVIEIEGRESLPPIDPNSFVARGLASILGIDDGAYIEPGTRCETTLLGPWGRRMRNPPRRELQARGGRR